LADTQVALSDERPEGHEQLDCELGTAVEDVELRRARSDEPQADDEGLAERPAKVSPSREA